jgi:hypothetical protein
MKHIKVPMVTLALGVILTLVTSTAFAQDLISSHQFPRGLSASDWSSIRQQMPAIPQQAYLKASNTEAFDQFGVAVGVSGDTVVVGARWESGNATGVNGNKTDNSASAAGAAYVFVRSGNTWSHQAYLKASNTGNGDLFGHSVAVSGDTVVVGAFAEDSNATGINGNGSDNNALDSGAAYVFVRSGTNWSQQAYLKASNTEIGDQFGGAVAISGDAVVVGANLEDSGSTAVNGDQSNNRAVDSGASYVFVRNGTNWSQQAYLKASNTGVNDQFGGSVTISGQTVVVGAAFEHSNAIGVNGEQSDNSAYNAGAAYVFVRSGITWTQQAYLKASNTGVDDRFGSAGGISGDTVVIGAHYEASNATGVNGSQTNNSAFGSGAAYIFTGLEPLSPDLAIERFGGSLRVAWLLPATNFVLERSDTLTPLRSHDSSWSQVPFPYQTNTTRIFITEPTPTGTRFYRLRKS